MTDNTIRQQTLLDQYWDADATNRQYIPDELDATLPETIDQFHAADDAPVPDREFVDGLWADLAGDTPAASTTASGWTDDPNDEPGEPQFIPQREGNQMQAKQQSNWRRRARQISELVAGILVLVLITGGLILAYENMIGEGGGETGPASDGSDGLVPDMSEFTEMDLAEDAFLAEIITIDEQDYGLFLTSPPMNESPGSVTLSVVRFDSDGSYQQVGELSAPESMGPDLTSVGRVSTRPIALDGTRLYVPLMGLEESAMWVVDVSDPTDPADDLMTRESGGASFVVSDDVLIHGQPLGSIQAYDISDPPAMERIGDGVQVPYMDSSPEMTIDRDNDQLFVVHSGGLAILDVSDPSAPEQIGAFEHERWTDANAPVDKFLDIALDGDFAYLSGSTDEILVLDISDPSNPFEVDWISRDNQTLRMTAKDGFLYVLGNEGIDQQTMANPSVEIYDLAAPDRPERVQHIEPLGEVRGGARDLLIGEDVAILYLGGAYLANIDWVEPADDEAGESPTLEPESTEIADEEPTPEPDEPSSEMPEQDPREVVVDVTSALDDDDWDRVRELNIPELREYNDSAIRSAATGDLPNLVAVGMLPLDSVDDWTVEHYEGWAVVRHREQPPVALVLIEHDGEWRIDPGFHNVRQAQVISEAGREGLREYSEPVTLGEWEGDADPIQISSSIEGNVAATRESESGLDVAVQLRFHPAEEATVSVDNIRWSADGANGQAEIVRTNASLIEDLVDFPLSGEDGGIYWMILRASDLPEDASNVVFTLEELQVSELQRTDVDVNDMVVSGTFDVPNQTWPDLPESISNDASSANEPVHFPRQPPGDHEYDDGGPVGTLALDDQGCLRVGDENGPVIIWPYEGFSAEMVDGDVALVNDETGNIVAHVGDDVSFHGSDPEYPLESVPEHMLNEPLPEACADADGYFITGPGIGAQ